MRRLIVQFGLLWWMVPTALAGMLDASDQPLVIWPNIPLISASDVEEFKLDRKIFRQLHLGELAPAVVKTNLKQVDKLYQHHKERSTDQIWRSYTTDLVAHYDQLVQKYQIKKPRLSFSFDGVSPAELKNELDLAAGPVATLREREDITGIIGFLISTMMRGNQLRATLTLIRLKDGESISFMVTDQLHKVATRHAQLLFDELYGTQYPAYQNPLSGSVWLLPAPADQGAEVSHRQALLACRSQLGELPSVDELLLGEQAGPYHNGIILSAGSFYHTAESKRYLAGETRDPRGKIRPMRSDQALARYYCLKPIELPQPVAPVAAVVEPATTAQPPKAESVKAQKK